MINVSTVWCGVSFLGIKLNIPFFCRTGKPEFFNLVVYTVGKHCILFKCSKQSVKGT